MDNWNTKGIVPAVEILKYMTKTKPLPKYKEFNQQFYKFISYFRYVVIAFFLKLAFFIPEPGRRKKQVKQEGKRFSKHLISFQLEHNEFPVLYRGNLFKKGWNHEAK